MILLYNFFLVITLVAASPFIIIKSITNKRFGYKIKDRFLPSFKIKDNNYILFHASSFGEVKTILNVTDKFEKNLKKTSVFSVFTDTGYKSAKDRRVFIMPVDFYPLYKSIFASPPELALFFETEIWPSYIYFLKKRGVKLALINARMSEKSFKMYKLFSFLFKKIIGAFDIIVAKSEQDAIKFKFFNNNVVVCGNIKRIKEAKNISEAERKGILKEFLIKTNKPIFTFGSVHKEELDFVARAVTRLKNDFFMVIAPRHREDSDDFYKTIRKSLSIKKRSERSLSDESLLLDTMGELEEVYKISDVVFVGGSTKETLKGHNPIEPLVYGKFVMSGPYMESFESEKNALLKNGLLKITDNTDELTQMAKKYIQTRHNINTAYYFNNTLRILECYIKQLKKV